MKWTILLLCLAIFAVSSARRVKREHLKHSKAHHAAHLDKLSKHHRPSQTRSHQDENLRSLHLERLYGCDCAHDEICVKGSGKDARLCVKKQFIKQGEKLLKEFKKHHPEITERETLHHGHHQQHRQPIQHHQPIQHRESPHRRQPVQHHRRPIQRDQPHDRTLQRDQPHHRTLQRVHHDEKPHDVQISIHAKHQKKQQSNKHHNEVNHRSDRILESHQRSGLMNAHKSHKETKVCTAGDFSDMRQRLTGWFRLLHAQEKENHHNHHGPHHKKHKHMSVKKELRDHHDGRCKAQPSVMWELHRLDVDDDHHLTNGELSEIENNSREPCLRPFLESCDTDSDGKLSGHEWRCCFADAIAPCYSKLRELQKNTVLETAAFIPRCDREGYYEKEQCRGHTMESRTCWCVDLNGNEIPKTRSRVRAHCEKVDVLGHKKRY